MATTDDSSLWSARWAGTDPPCSGEGGQAEEWTENETHYCPDLAAICDAFDTDDAEPLPEHGDFWEQSEEQEQ